MSNTNREEMNNLLDSTLKAAVFLLEKNKELYPFAQVLDNKHQIASIASYDGNEHPKSQEVIERLEEVLRTSIKEKQ